MSKTTPTCAKSTKIETSPCTRCGGTGRYSWCAMYGDRCFKCSGAGHVLTKRGAEANRYLKELRSLPAYLVTPGTLIWTPIGLSGYGFRRVVSREVITEENAGCRVKSDGGEWRVNCLGGFRIETTSSVSEHPATEMLRVGQTAEQKAETLARALEYQDTLTKSGTPRKK